MTIYDEHLSDVIEEIEYWTPNGFTAGWVVKTKVTPPDSTKPWITDPPTENVIPVRILFLPDVLEDRQLQKYLKKTEIGEGQVNGFMQPYTTFSPNKNDVVRRYKELDPIDPDEFVELVVKAIDEYRPADKTLLYILEFGL